MVNFIYIIFLLTILEQTELREFLVKNKKFDVDDFCEMQLDLKDLRAKSILPDLIKVLS